MLRPGAADWRRTGLLVGKHDRQGSARFWPEANLRVMAIICGECDIRESSGLQFLLGALARSSETMRTAFSSHLATARLIGHKRSTAC